MNMIAKAEQMATLLHAGQVRPFTGEPYIGHPARVVGILQQYGYDRSSSDFMLAAAWLHDVIEDTPATWEAVEESFGDIVATLVVELTKPNEPRTTFARIIKAADMIDNIGTISSVAPRAQAQAYLAKKAPQVLAISEALRGVNPALAEALAQAFWRNWELAS